MNNLIGGTTTDTVRNLHISWLSTTTFQMAYWGSDLNSSSTSTVGTGEVMVCTQSGTGRTIHQNGTQIGSDSNTTLLTDYLDTEIGRFPAGGWFFSGDIAEIIMYSKALSTPERDQVESYLGAKWGITVA